MIRHLPLKSRDVALDSEIEHNSYAREYEDADDDEAEDNDTTRPEMVKMRKRCVCLHTQISGC